MKRLKRDPIKPILAILPAAVLLWSLTACAIKPASEKDASYQEVAHMLDQDGVEIDYDTLMQVYQKIIRSHHRIAHLDQLLDKLIHKRNTNPRIDQMILIFSARIIGQSTIFIPKAGELIFSILQQDDRLNEWVIAFVADAIGNYPFNLPEGDTLVDCLEAKLSMVKSKDRSQEEYFGYHFLPPPKSSFIRSYIGGIESKALRGKERNSYYALIQNNMTENEIESALKYLKLHGEPGSGADCPLLLECLIRNLPRWPFGE